MKKEKTTTTTTANERIVITLTGRRPISIISADWPIIACAKVTLTEGKMKHEFCLFARMNPDGRAIIYGNGSKGRGGKYLSTPHTMDKVAYQIGVTGRELDVPTELIEKCIASLPAEVLESGPSIAPLYRSTNRIRPIHPDECDEDDA